MDGNGEKGDAEASIPSGISSVFDDRVDDENLLTVYETENLSLRRTWSKSTLRQEAAAMAERIRALEQRTVTWDSTQEWVESVQAELVTDIYMQLREKYEGEFKTNQQQLAKQQSEFKIKYNTTAISEPTKRVE